MFDLDKYLADMIMNCRSAFGERLLYVGLQGIRHVAISMSEDLPQQDPNSGKFKHVVNMQRNL